MSKRFPDLRGVVLQDGHVDPVTGPRCMVKMQEGEHNGLYQIACTDTVLWAGTEVMVDQITRRAKPVQPLAARSAERKL